MKQLAMSLSLGLCLAGMASAQAQVVSGLTFSVTTDGDYPHGSVQTGTATTGFYDIVQFERGLSEFNLSGLQTAQTAMLSFRYASQSSTQGAAYPLSGSATLYSYAGDNAAEVTDYGATRTGTVGSFAIESFHIGDTISLDVTSLVNAAIARHDAAFGIGFQVTGPYFRRSGVDSFVGYDNFRLDVSRPVGVPAVPEPGTWAFLFGGMVVTGAWVRRNRLRRGTTGWVR